MKSLLRRLEKLERGTSTDASDFSFGSDQEESATRRGGRTIDLTELENLSALQCTEQELASRFGVNQAELEQLREHPPFREAIERGRARGKISIRRAQMQMLARGSATMARWLGKHHLGQSDQVDAGRPVPIIVIPSVEGLKAEEAKTIADPGRNHAPRF